MRAVAIGISRRSNFVRIDRPCTLGTIDVPACANQFVISVRCIEALTDLEFTVPVLGSLEFQDVGQLVVSTT